MMKKQNNSNYFCILFLILYSHALFASSPIGRYCTALYGELAYKTFDPADANGGGVIDSYFRKSTPVDFEGAPKPTGFRCQIAEGIDKKTKCPRDMHLDYKRIGRPVCITKKINLKELCPDEIADAGSEFKERLCKSLKSSKNCENKVLVYPPNDGFSLSRSQNASGKPTEYCDEDELMKKEKTLLKVKDSK